MKRNREAFRCSGVHSLGLLILVASLGSWGAPRELSGLLSGIESRGLAHLCPARIDFRSPRESWRPKFNREVLGLKASKQWVARGCAILLGILGLLSWGYAIGEHGVFPAKYVNRLVNELRAFASSSDEDPRTLFQKLEFGGLEFPSSYDFKGFQYDDVAFVDPGYVLAACYSAEDGQSVFELYRVQDGQKIHTWAPPMDEILGIVEAHLKPDTPLAGDWLNGRVYHPLLFPNGDIVFRLGMVAIVRMSASGELAWVLPGDFHHSLELDHDGNIVANTRLSESFEDFPLLHDDGYAILSPDGKILERRSVMKILLDNHYDGLAIGAGLFIKDRLHVNDAHPIVQPHGSSQVGDIAISPRNLSTVFLYRPATNAIVWLKTGPWLGQHDVDPLDDGRFSIFGNDVMMMYSGPESPSDPPQETQLRYRIRDRISRIYVFDPESGAVSSPYEKVLLDLGMQSFTEGRARILRNGDAFIEEQNHNRLLRVSPQKSRWQFVRAVKDDTVSILSWSRYLHEDEVDIRWLALAEDSQGQLRP